MAARLAGEEKKSQAAVKDIGKCCTLFKLYTLLITVA
jgi:hypothetical protein